MDIKSKLARLDGRGRSVQPDLLPEEDWIESIRLELDIGVIREAKSFVLLKENTFPAHEAADFRYFREQAFTCKRLWRLAPELGDSVLNLRKTLFFDTETTGLSGGAGTYAFLVGVGFIELDHIVVRQYLLPDFGHEWLMLETLNRLFQGFTHTVSFNGKSFDLPLLRSRYVLNQITPHLEDLIHIDVLHAARRIWREVLPACNLQSLERHVLGISREGDIPGEIIPQLYFEFIRKRRALILRDVLEHNYHDIVNMMLLTIRIGAIADAPQLYLKAPHALLSMARYYHKQGLFDASSELAVDLLESHGDQDSRLNDKCLYLLSMNHKKLGQRDAARAHLTRLIDRNVLQPEVITELAKIYEHTDGDYAEALSLVESGLKYLETIRQLGHHQKFRKFHAPLLHRKRRLERRLQND